MSTNTGRILCRLGEYIRPLGDYFLLQQRPGFQPHFEVYAGDYHADKQQVSLHCLFLPCYLTDPVISSK